MALHIYPVQPLLLPRHPRGRRRRSRTPHTARRTSHRPGCRGEGGGRGAGWLLMLDTPIDHFRCINFWVVSYLFVYIIWCFTTKVTTLWRVCLGILAEFATKINVVLTQDDIYRNWSIPLYYVPAHRTQFRCIVYQHTIHIQLYSVGANQ